MEAAAIKRSLLIGPWPMHSLLEWRIGGQQQQQQLTSRTRMTHIDHLQEPGCAVAWVRNMKMGTNAQQFDDSQHAANSLSVPHQI